MMCLCLGQFTNYDSLKKENDIEMQNGKHLRTAAHCLPWGYFRKSSVACKVPPRIERCR